MPFAANMDGRKDDYNKWSKLYTERQIWYTIYKWNLKKNDTDEFIYKTNRLTDIESKLTMIKGEKWWLWG